jgi:hypothetical protein
MKTLLLFPVCCFAASITTGHYNNNRDSANTQEGRLTQSNVATGKFGKLGSYALDGESYTQPLIVENVSIQGAATVVVGGTGHGSAYCFDADRPGSAYLWKTTLTTPRTSFQNAENIYGHEWGVGSTPVIANGIVYIVSASGTNSGNAAFKLFALNLSDGSEAVPAVTIAGTYSGVTFNPFGNFQRTSLLYTAGNIYICFGSQADSISYYGWVFAYSATTLARTGIWASTLDNSAFGAGLWMGGGGPAVDGDGNIVITTGNGALDGTNNFGESFVKLSPSLAVLDYLAPSNFAALNAADSDLGSGGPLLFSTFALASGKDGRIIIINQSAYGGVQGSGGTVVQIWQASPGTSGFGHYGGQAYANGNLYIGFSNHQVYKFTFGGSTFNTSPVTTTTGVFRHPGASVVYSSNGAVAGTGVVWATTFAASSVVTARPGTLRAFNADSLVELYNSDTRAGDTLGTLSKFTEPTVSNGRVYVATLDSTIAVYGLLPSTQSRGRINARGGARIR